MFSQRLAQHLRLPRSNKNARVGVAGASTPTRGFVWFHLSGIEDDPGKNWGTSIRIEEITKDLPLHPIPGALKWDHLSDLKLADSDFRTSARIGMLLGAEVFTSILPDGQWTRPRGTPPAINTFFGWVHFGKIQGSVVVDMANLTLQQDVLRELTGSRHLYAAVFTVNKKRDLCYL